MRLRGKRSAERWLQLQEQAQMLLALRSSEAPPEQLQQELSELLYYVVQRSRYRFGEFYNYAFNPSVLAG